MRGGSGTGNRRYGGTCGRACRGTLIRFQCGDMPQASGSGAGTGTGRYLQFATRYSLKSVLAWVDDG